MEEIDKELLYGVKASELPKIERPTTGRMIFADGDKLSTSPLEYFLNVLNTSVIGNITTTQTLSELNALVDGVYQAQTSGTYANGLIAKEAYLTRFRKVGTDWSLESETQLPNDGLSELDFNSPISINSKAVKHLKEITQEFEIPVGKNIFPVQFPYIVGSYIEIDGVINVSSDFNIFKIPVKAGSNYTIRTGNRLCFFTEDDAFISGDNSNQGGNVTIITPALASYMLLTVHNDVLSTQQVEASGSFTGYEEQVFGSKSLFIGLDNIIGLKAEFLISGKSTDSVKISKTTEGVLIKITERLVVFSQNKNNSTYFIQPQEINVPNGSYVFLKFEDKTIIDAPNYSDITLSVVDYNYYNHQLYNYVIGIAWEKSFLSSHTYFDKNSTSDSSTETQLKDADYFSNKNLVKPQIKSFLEKWVNLTDNDKPLEVLLVGDSLTNFQNCTEWKTDKTVEPQGLYGNSWGRWLWRRLNYTFTLNQQDSANDSNFTATNQNEFGNLRFIRADNSTVTKTGDWIPHGTRDSDGARIWWSQREYIVAASTALGGFRGTLDDSDSFSTSLGTMKSHNQVYFFSKDANASLTFNIPASAKGFSLVFWGDVETVDFRQLPTTPTLNLSKNVEIKVNGVVVSILDLTTKRGQTRVDFPLSGSGAKTIVVTNKDNGKVVNLWGVEYWVGKAVRVVNSALAGNSTRSFIDAPEFFIDKPADLIVWETTTLNNVGGESQVENHIQLGNMLKNKNSQIVVLTAHPVSEDISTVTNYVSRETDIKKYQHKDAFAVNKALSILNLQYLDVFNYFKQYGEQTGFRGDYNLNFVDLTHLSKIGARKYIDLLECIFTFK